MGVFRRYAPSLLLTLLVAAGALSSCNRSEQQPGTHDQAAAPAAPVDENGDTARQKIVILGDSLTAGLGLLETQAFPALLQKRIDAEGYHYEVDNAGVSGDTSAGGLRRLEWALDGRVRVLVVALGGNDGLRGLSVAELKSNLTEIIHRARERGVTVVLAGMEAPPNYGAEYAQSFHQAYRDVALKEHVLFIPFLLDKVAGHPELNQADGIHPNTQGADIVAENVWGVLKPLLDQIASAS